MDPDETHVQLAKQIIDHAGVSHKVEVIQGTLQTSTEVGFSTAVLRLEY
jgi:predicted O-methyltransferase YrrM